MGEKERFREARQGCEIRDWPDRIAILVEEGERVVDEDLLRVGRKLRPAPWPNGDLHESLGSFCRLTLLYQLQHCPNSGAYVFEDGSVRLVLAQKCKERRLVDIQALDQIRPAAGKTERHDSAE